MVNRRTFSIVKRELKVKLFSRTFIIMTLLIPIFMLGIMGLQTFLFQYSDGENAFLIVASESQNVLDNIQTELSKMPKNQDGNVEFMFEKLDRAKDRDKVKQYSC